MGASISMRRFAAGDQAAVRDLVIAGLVEHWGTVADPTLNRDLDDIATTYADAITLVATTPDGTVVGTGTIVPRAAGIVEIVRMSVSSARRGQGIGRQIVEALIVEALNDAARAAHDAPPIERVVLETTSTWHGTVRFYESCGFVVTHHADGEFGRDAWFERRLTG